MVTLALHRGAGIAASLIRWRTHSRYSHVELVIDGLCYSSAAGDGGVRAKRFDIGLSFREWSLIELPWADPHRVFNLYSRTAGSGYDWQGVIVGRLLDSHSNKRRRYFCSEWVAEALGFDEPWRFTPGDLAAVCAPWREARRVLMPEGSR